MPLDFINGLKHIKKSRPDECLEYFGFRKEQLMRLNGESCVGGARSCKVTTAAAAFTGGGERQSSSLCCASISGLYSVWAPVTPGADKCHRRLPSATQLARLSRRLSVPSPIFSKNSLILKKMGLNLWFLSL